ncbi:DnaJ-like protein subfamily C member 24 [Larimichthys crocea]|uniref:DnaJ-like protein subfamily C member 24 n=1 Tax=Larimichthys crocea TaxID=215358 RepID=A0A6G0J051_LARCR|nr:DnaJ-like protein subfamily C member 24 [Larimichthys crocea]
MCDAAQKDLYAVLGASSADSAQQLRQRYQQLALQYHPDRLGGEASSEVESAVKKFLEVDAAWRILSDQDTRRQYDLQRRAQELKQDWPVDCTVCLDDMTWDQGVLTPRLRTGVLNDRAILLSAGLRQTHKGMKAGNDSALSLVTQPAKVTADRGSK